MTSTYGSECSIEIGSLIHNEKMLTIFAGEAGQVALELFSRLLVVHIENDKARTFYIVAETEFDKAFITVQNALASPSSIVVFEHIDSDVMAALMLRVIMSGNPVWVGIRQSTLALAKENITLLLQFNIQSTLNSSSVYFSEWTALMKS